MNWFFIVISGLLGAGAGIFLRLSHISDINPWILRAGAIGLYGMSFITYALALKKLNLNVAYPVMVSIVIFSSLVFTGLHEGALKPPQIIGAVLIAIGIFMISKFS
jgi:small multidrug resistance pump